LILKFPKSHQCLVASLLPLSYTIFYAFSQYIVLFGTTFMPLIWRILGFAMWTSCH